MTRSTPPRAPTAASVVRYGVEWFAGGAWSASARREAAEEAGRVVRAFGTEARVVLLVACPVPGPSGREVAHAD